MSILQINPGNPREDIGRVLDRHAMACQGRMLRRYVWRQNPCAIARGMLAAYCSCMFGLNADDPPRETVSEFQD